MRLIDITLPLGPATPRYPGDPPVQVERLSEARGGDTYALSCLTLGSHAGTHIDAPAHFLPGGATSESIDLDACIGPARVFAVPAGVLAITGTMVRAVPASPRLLLRTGGRALGGAALDASGARAVVERGVRLVGIDALSIAPGDAPGEVHRILLEAGVVILESLDLRAAEPGEYTLLCLPLRLAGCDGAPARAVLVAGSASDQ